MRQFYTFLTLCLLFFCQPFPALGETITHASGASLHRAPGWTRGEAAEGAALVLFAPNPSPQFRPNINLLIQETGPMTADDYRRLSEKQSAEMGGRTDNYREFTLDDGSLAHSMLIHFSYQNLQLTSLSVWLMREGKTYLITATAEASDFGQRESSFLEIVQSFRLQKAPKVETEGGPLGFMESIPSRLAGFA